MLNAYSLLYAVLLITSGRLGDIYGPRNVFAVGVAIFTAASAVSAGSSLQLPPGIPQQVVLSLQNAAHYVFTHAFVDAMRPR